MEISGQFHVPAALLRGQETTAPLGSRLGGPRSQFGRCDECKSCRI